MSQESLFSIENAEYQRMIYHKDKYVIAQFSVKKDYVNQLIQALNLIPEAAAELAKKPFAVDYRRLSIRPDSKCYSRKKYENDSDKPAIQRFFDDDIVPKTKFHLSVSKVEWSSKYNSFTFIVNDCFIIPDTQAERMKKFLTTYIQGIGESKAERLISEIGADNLPHIIVNDLNTVAKVLKIPMSLDESSTQKNKLTAETIKEDWQKNYYVMELSEKCRTLNLSDKVIDRAIQFLRHQAYNKLVNEPYKLLNYKEKGKRIHILSWDDIEVMKMPDGTKINQSDKIQAALFLAYQDLTLETGSTMALAGDLIDFAHKKYLSKLKIDDVMSEFMKVSENDIPVQEQNLNNNTLFYLVPSSQVQSPDDEQSNEEYLYAVSADDRQMESFIYNKIVDYLQPRRALFTDEQIEKFKQEKNNLDDTQRKAVLTFMTKRLMYITGSPGVGKSYLCKFLKRIAEEAGLRIAFCAPTGKAAQRINENLGTNEAQTIHRLFKINPDDVENEGFTASSGYDDEESVNINDYDIIVFDESSMISLSLASKVFAIVNPDTTALVFVGDKDQLPPIERGSFYHDILSSPAIPAARLEILHRIDPNSLVTKNAQHIKNNEPCETHTTHDFEFMNAISDLSIQMKIKEYVQKLMSENNNILDIQILSPQSTHGAGVDVMNKILRPIMNPNFVETKTKKDDNFCIGDKVMQTRNDADRNVFNGLVGIITDIQTMEVSDGRRKPNTTLTVEFYNGNQNYSVIYESEKDQLSELVLAYAITIHKSQGSDYPYVIIPISKNHSKMWNKKLLYTGHTRTKKKVFYAGYKDYLIKPQYLPDAPYRYTNLKRYLANLGQ